jgi:hypothetical protein
MSIKMDDLDEMDVWFTLVNRGLETDTVKFYQELADINGKASSLHYLIEAAEGLKDYLSQGEDEEYITYTEDEFFSIN